MRTAPNKVSIKAGQPHTLRSGPPPPLAKELAVLWALNELIATLRRAQGTLTQSRGAAEPQR